MEDITVEMQSNNTGFISLMVDKAKMGYMEIVVAGEILTVSHTEVLPEGQGKGYAGKLLTALVEYARKKHYKINAACSYVESQFKRHPEEYADIRLNH